MTIRWRPFILPGLVFLGTAAALHPHAQTTPSNPRGATQSRAAAAFTGNNNGVDIVLHGPIIGFSVKF